MLFAFKGTWLIKMLTRFIGDGLKKEEKKSNFMQERKHFLSKKNTDRYSNLMTTTKTMKKEHCFIPIKWKYKPYVNSYELIGDESFFQR